MPSKNPFETPDIVSSSEAYAARFAGSVGAWLLRIQERALIGMLDGRRPLDVLDVGGGHGQVASALLKQNHRVTILSSPKASNSQILHLVDGVRCSHEVGSILDLPFSARSFDVVISIRMLAHVQQWRSFLSELCRVAAQAVIVDFPSKRSANALTPMLFGLKRRVEKDTRRYASFSESQLRMEFQAHGFELVERHAEFFFPMVIHRALKAPSISRLLESVVRWTGLTSLFGSPLITKFERRDR